MKGSITFKISYTCNTFFFSGNKNTSLKIFDYSLVTKEQWSFIRQTLTVYISSQILDESGGIVRVVQITLPDGNNGWVAINP